MKYPCILFDLDGTLTDSGEGIINCAVLALEHFSLPVPDRAAMRVFVGPPLRDTFIRFGVPEDRVEEAITVYRSRYTTVGKFENFPYPGIPEMLEALHKAGHRLFIATSKPEHMAVEIAEKFGIAKYFEAICGATLDGSRDAKEKVIEYLLTRCGVEGAIMVGDTHFDVTGAKFHGIDAIGVSWGYGEVCQMEQAGAIAIAHTAEELQTMLTAP
ncbi:MAG: HAD family hydrolase [Ruminococcaceae bacterium]|nr:HAD family hydrolase [Oscillospiraceae bacterium]